MSNSQRVAVITGASQGIGDGLVSRFRKLGYAVVANSRTIGDSDDPMVSTVPGDISQPGVGQRIVDAAMERSAGSTRWSTTRGSSSQSRSPTTPTTTMTPSPA